MKVSVEEIINTMAVNDGLPPNWDDARVEEFCKDRGCTTLADAFRLGMKNLASTLTGHTRIPVTIRKDNVETK